MNYSIDGQPFSFHVDSPLFVGDDVVLSRLDGDISLECPWAEAGYTVAAFLQADCYRDIRQGVSELMRRRLGAGDDFALA